jgi:hypothetical protein
MMIQSRCVGWQALLPGVEVERPELPTAAAPSLGDIAQPEPPPRPPRPGDADFVGPLPAPRAAEPSRGDLPAEDNAKRPYSPIDDVDTLQNVLDWLGWIPGLGIFAEAANAGISFNRGDNRRGWLHIAGIIPLGRYGVKAGRVTGRATRRVSRSRLKGRQKTFSKGSRISNEILKTKPKYGRDPKKWMNEGGQITITKDGVWRYTSRQGVSINYPGGYPDFKSAGFVRQEVDIGRFRNYSYDFRKANKLTGGLKDSARNTWHHHQDGKTLQEVPRKIHRQFTHEGGMSITRKRRDVT